MNKTGVNTPTAFPKTDVEHIRESINPKRVVVPDPKPAESPPPKPDTSSTGTSESTDR